MILYSYKIIHDDGFAPNPYFGLLTLATCKPSIRKGPIKAGDWLSAWSSASLKGCQTKVGEEKLIYLAKVSKKITFEEYWEQYPQKRPVENTTKNMPEYYGDNIYKPDAGAPLGFIQIPEANFHTKFSKEGCDLVNKSIEHDLKGKYVLICDEFYYFSYTSPLTVPNRIKETIRMPRFQGHIKTETDFTEFINFVKANSGGCKLKS